MLAGNRSLRRMPSDSSRVSIKGRLGGGNLEDPWGGRTVTLDMQVVVAIRVSEGSEQSPLIQVLIPSEPARSRY